MPILILLLSLIMLPLQAVEKPSHSAVWGKVVRAEKTVKGVNYKYFIYFEKDGKPEAYPIDTDKKEIKELIEKNLNMSVRVEGEVKEVELKPTDDISVRDAIAGRRSEFENAKEDSEPPEDF